MPQPWKVGPTRRKGLGRLRSSKDRADLIKKLAPDGDYGKNGFTGVFYYDDKTGTSHGYSPLSYNIIYDAPPMGATTPQTMIVTPIREAELKYRVNDPAAPNCVGKYLASAVEPAQLRAHQSTPSATPAPRRLERTPGAASSARNKGQAMQAPSVLPHHRARADLLRVLGTRPSA